MSNEAPEILRVFEREANQEPPHASEVRVLLREYSRLRDIVDNLHPRTIKLALRGEPFIIIGCHEPYFRAAYDMIRVQEQRQGTWTREDEEAMARAVIRGHNFRLAAKAAKAPKETPCR